MRRKKSVKLEWEEAEDIRILITHLVSSLPFEHIEVKRIFTYRSSGSSSRSYARIWSFPKIFQHALSLRPAYVIEVLSKYFDKLSEDEKKKVLIHELLHIPKNFSGALVPHRTRSKHIGREVNVLFKLYKSQKI